MKVSILSPDLSENCLGRALILAHVLQRSYEVEVLGPRFGNTIWGPAVDEPLMLKPTAVGRGPQNLARLIGLAEEADGDVLYVSKPLLASLGVGLLGKLRRDRPLVLDIDDWERGFSRDAFAALDGSAKLRHLVGSAMFPHRNHSFWNIRICERLVRFADAVTVSNRYLLSRFGGTLVWHGRDTRRMTAPPDPGSLRDRYGLPKDRPVVAYMGTIRPYKGIDLLVEAVAGLQDRGVVLLLVGAGEDPQARETLARARERLGQRLVSHGVQPIERIPEFLSMADVVSVPQRSGEATRGQMPAKLFDAMAVGRPIVASAVSDIPYALEGCGWVVAADSVAALAGGIVEVLDHPAEAARRGAAARARCETEFSLDAMAVALGRVFSRLE